MKCQVVGVLKLNYVENCFGVPQVDVVGCVCVCWLNLITASNSESGPLTVV